MARDKSGRAQDSISSWRARDKAAAQSKKKTPRIKAGLALVRAARAVIQSDRADTKAAKKAKGTKKQG